MHFRLVLVELDRIERELRGGVTAKEFVDHCSSRIPISNARVYLLRLFKMNLARRRKDRSIGSTNHPYRYIVSKTGRKYIRYLDEGHFMREADVVERMNALIERREYDRAIQLYEESESLFFNQELKEIAREVHRLALELAIEALRRKRQS